MQITLTQIREKYLKFFQSKNHAMIGGASLIPENDPSLLFTNSGMSPLVPYLLGETHPEGKRIADSQKCFRAEDIEEVGDNRHNTFFEMLGNWSLGDYFKRDQLNWWYEFLIDEVGLDPKRLYQTVYLGDKKLNIAKDQESVEILQEIFTKYGVNAEVGPDTPGKGALGSGQKIDFSRQRIFAYRDKNWWQRGDAIGELGGPDSETFYDTGRAHNSKFGEFCHLNCDCGRFVEIGNSVFMQYQKTAEGWRELAAKNVDFGGGLERVLMAAIGENNIFKTDAFAPLIKKIEELSGKQYGDDEKSFEIIADHIKAATFIIGDDKGVSPSNTDQGYIVRRLLRRAIRYGRRLGIEKLDWIGILSRQVIEIYQDFYSELSRNNTRILDEIRAEEEKFSKTIDRGLKVFQEMQCDQKKFNGKLFFDLYQSHGFPIEMSFEEAQKTCGLSDVEKADITQEFNEELKKHQELSRTASAGKFKGGLADVTEETGRLHTATHLLLAALRQILGDHVEQRGSNITADRLRLDFSHGEKMTPEQIKQAEDIVNNAIAADAQIVCEEKELEEARSEGAVGIFDSKYSQKVKIYTVQKDGKIFSKEICGGPHANRTGELGVFKIVKEESSSSGVRRIKAVLKQD